jgi:hypothetical protein
LQELGYFTVGIIHGPETFGSRGIRTKLFSVDGRFLTLHAVCLRQSVTGILFLSGLLRLSGRGLVFDAGLWVFCRRSANFWGATCAVKLGGVVVIQRLERTANRGMKNGTT